MLEANKVLLIGGSGQLGSALGATFARGYRVVATAHTHAQAGQLTLDLGDSAATSALLQRERPAVVLIAGAMCHVDLCEQQPELCRRINVEGPAAVADYARGSGAQLVFFSTDHVFDGSGPSYVEDDEMHPLSVYASSKMEAEHAIRDLAPAQHLIIRTGWVYGPDPQRRNFILRLIARLRLGETVEVPSDQAGCPSFTEDIAEAARYLLETGANGTFHAVGPDYVDRVALSRRVCARFHLDPARVIARPTSELGQIARRSLRVRLDCRKLHETGAPEFRGIDAGLDALDAWSGPAVQGNYAR